MPLRGTPDPRSGPRLNTRSGATAADAQGTDQGEIAVQLRRKILITIALVALVGGVVGVGTFSAFSSTTTNSGNTFAAGTVFLTDNDSGSAMYNVPAGAPGTSVTRCIVLTYGG